MPLVPVTGLEDEAGDRLRALELDDFLELGQRLVGRVPAALRCRGTDRSTWTTPGMPGSVAQRRGSPVSVIAPAVPP